MVAEGIGAIVLASCKFEFVINRGTLLKVCDKWCMSLYYNVFEIFSCALTVDMGVIGFALAQLVNSVVLLIVYYGCCALEVWGAHFTSTSTTTDEQTPGSFFGSISSWLPNPVIEKSSNCCISTNPHWH